MPPERASVLGVPRPRIDSREKVTGAVRYAADLSIPGMLHARIVPSTYAHARVRGVDATAALRLKGVVAVLTARDLPIVGSGDGRRFEPLARDEVVFAGQPVALAVAETEAAAEDAVDLVTVDLEPLVAIVDPMAAIEADAPLFRLTPALEAADDEGFDEPVSANVFSRERSRRGDAGEAFARCDAIVEGRFHAAWAYQAYLEPHAVVANIEPDGTLAVISSTQGTMFTRNELAAIFGLAPAKVRVKGAPLGGAFGSKVVVVEPLAAGAALRLRRPVRLVLTRREDFAATNPAQGLIVDLRIGAARSGRLEALEARIIYDAGAYTEGSWEWFASTLVTGPYRWPAFDVLAYGVRTNRVGAGSYRAPSGPQGVFALESLVDELAERLELDPIDLRLANLADEGDPMADGDPWPVTGTRECLQRLADHPLWARRRSRPPGEGIGLALGIWHGIGVPAAAMCRVEPDGTISVITGVVDISGSLSSLALIAAETFGVPPDTVTIITADSSVAPHAPMGAGSGLTYGVGPAVQQAAAQARDRLLAVAADELEIDPADLEVVDGLVRPRGSPHLGRPIAEFAASYDDFGSNQLPIEGHAATAHKVNAPSAAAHLVRLRVSDETGELRLLDYVVAQDVGRALNPALVEGQMVGGAVQSIGRAIHEELIHDDVGQLLTGSFLDYAVPKAADLPPIETLIVEVPAPEGPFGARGIGESSILAGPAAIANAVAAATGLRMRELPITARRIWEARRGSSTDLSTDRTG